MKTALINNDRPPKQLNVSPLSGNCYYSVPARVEGSYIRGDTLINLEGFCALIVKTIMGEKM